jgi:hypothetical protein
MKRLFFVSIVAAAVAYASGWPALSAARTARPDKSRLRFARDVGGAHARWDAHWQISTRGQRIGVIVGAAVCGEEAFLLDVQLAAVHRVDLTRETIVASFGSPSQLGPHGLRHVGSVAADCGDRLLYVADDGGVAVFAMDSSTLVNRYAKPGTFENNVGAAVLDRDAGMLYVPGLWAAQRSDWLVKPVDRMFEGDFIGYQLDVRTGRTAPVVPAVERGCWSLGPNCVYAVMDRMNGPSGSGWVAAHVNGMYVGVYDSASRLVRTIDVRSPKFLETGLRNLSKSIREMAAWNEDNSAIRDLYAFGDSIVTVHSYNRLRGWKPGMPLAFDVYMNVHAADGTGITSDVRLPDLPVGRDATSIYVVDYSPAGRLPRTSLPVSLYRIPIAQ